LGQICLSISKAFKLFQMQFELQPHFLEGLKILGFSRGFGMANHEDMQKDLIRGEVRRLGKKWQRP
jgi:hypothetical protein